MATRAFAIVYDAVLRLSYRTTNKPTRERTSP